MKLYNYFEISLFVLAVWVTSQTLCVVIDGLSDEGKTADAAVILGNKVNEDGNLPTRLKQRLECGLQLYCHRRTKGLLVSGGLGKEGFLDGDKMTEGLLEKAFPIP
jgi:vancomycin permeability regulator SanA